MTGVQIIQSHGKYFYKINGVAVTKRQAFSQYIRNYISAFYQELKEYSSKMGLAFSPASCILRVTYWIRLKGYKAIKKTFTQPFRSVAEAIQAGRYLLRDKEDVISVEVWKGNTLKYRGDFNDY